MTSLKEGIATKHNPAPRRHQLTLALLATTGLASAHAHTHDLTLPTLNVTASQESLETRQESPTNLIVVGRDEIERYQEDTLGNLLRKLPGVTFTGPPGNPKDIRLRGLEKGYTRILIDGEEVSSGTKERQVQVDMIPADLIERIEIIRNRSASDAASGIGGAINIVLRPAPEQFTAGGRIGVSHQYNRERGEISVRAGDRVGGISYLMAGQFAERVEGKDKLNDTQEFNPAGLLTKREATLEQEFAEVREYSLTPRLSLALSDQDTLRINPYVIRRETDKTKALYKEKYEKPFDPTHRTGNGQTLETEDFDRDIYRLSTEWTHQASERTEWISRVSAQTAKHDKDKLKTDLNPAGTPTKRTDETERKREREYTASFSARHVLNPQHTLGSGVLVGRLTRDDTKTVLENDKPKTVGLGDRYDIAEDKLALWLDDSWTLTSQHTLTPGVRLERTLTRTEDDLGDRRRSARNDLLPSLHYLWQISPQDNLRASIAKTVKAPKFDELSHRAESASGANTNTNPDKSGNPSLSAESALGYELGIEHFFAQRIGMLGLNLFYRDIDDLIEKQTLLEGDRFVERPYNVGQASFWGAELEGRLRMDIVNLPELTLSANYTRLQSSVEDQTTGQSRRMKDQPPYVYNLGADYRIAAWDLSLGAHYNRTGSHVKQDNALQRDKESAQSLVDIYAAKRLSKELALRLTASNLTDFQKVKDKTTFDNDGNLRKVVDEREWSTPLITLALEGQW